MNVSPNVNLERIEEADLKLQFQFNKCLNEKQRRESTSDYLDELAGYISASASDMCSLSVNPDKCAILQETVNQIRQIKLAEESYGDDLQQSEVSSSKPNLFGSDLLGPLLLHALDGFLFMVNTDGKIEFITTNVKSFLKYSQESLIDKSIYNIIHVGDHARFSSNLLPMSIGNGFGWSEPNTSVSKSRSFNCRFLIKPPEDQEETMEEKQTRVSQYENMQISAVLLPFGEKSEPDDLDVQNHLVCVARRSPPNEKNNAPGAEFQTRLDVRGKILSIDNSGISATCSQYINKDLVGRTILDLCHPDDFQKINQHLKETLQQGNNTSGIYRLRLAHEKIIHVQTRSTKRYNTHMASEQEIILANHTVIRDSDHCLENNVVVPQRSNPTPASGTIIPSLSSNMNGNSYSFTSLSPQEFSLNDIGLEFLPSSSWDLSGTEEQNLGDAANLPTSLGAPSTPASTGSVNSGAQQRTQHPSGSAFSPELLSGRGSPSTRSPAQLSATGSPAPGRVTPFSNTFPFSPVSTQTISRTSSPAPNLIKREEPSTPSNNHELSSLSPMGGLIGDSQNSTNNATQKLRNLLTHGIEEADSSVPKNSSSIKMEDVSGETENGFVSRNSADVSSRNENIILRELLNQEDEDMNEENAKNLPCDTNCNVNLAPDMCSNDSLAERQKRTVNNNNMLRKLLNSDDDKSFKKTQDLLIQQLLKNEGKVAVDANMSPASSKAGSTGLPNSSIEVISTVVKRKSPDTPTDDSVAKRPVPQNPQHAHLAGQNPMLASMLAQTPRTAPTVSTSIANAIVSQLPQERLPKNLEKKLVHTPYTGAPTSGTSTASNNMFGFTHVTLGGRRVLSTSLQQEVVTADSRGHVTLAPQNNSTSNFPQTSNFLNKMLPPGDNAQNVNLQVGNYGNHFVPNSEPQTSLQSTTNLLFDGIDANNGDPNNMINTSDPLLSEILDQVWSMEQDMNLDSTSSDDINLFKLLEEIPDPPPAASPRPASAHDVNEKLAINAIQRQLMSFEIPGSPTVSRNSPRFQQPASVPMVMPQSQMAQSSYSQVNQYQAAPPAYTMSNPTQRTRTPGIHAAQNSAVNMPTSQQMVQMNSQRQNLAQFSGLSPFNDLSTQMRRHIMEHKLAEQRKLFVQQQQQKRLLLQQKQQLSLNTRQTIPDNVQNVQSPAAGPFSENMGDLMNNTVAPNVTLQRSTSMPEPQLSPRYSSVQQLPNSGAPPPSPSQLSPGQRQQPPFSPISQQGYPSNYPQSRLSPHMQSQPGPTQAWVQRASQNPANIQQQNPMLNAQLSQQASFASQARFAAQQQQPRQIVVRSMPSPGSRNSPYSNPPDSPFHPPSPGVLYQQQASALPQQQTQAPQQRLQRAVSIPNRVNSPRGLPAGFTGNEPILSPQPSPGSYNPPASNYNSAMPVSTSSNYNSDNFSYDQQVYPPSMLDRNRGNGGSNMTSEYVRQEIRAMVGARTQQQHQVHQQQLVQQMPQTSGSQSTNQSLSQADFEALGFSLDSLDGQPSSPALFPQSLLSVAGANENQSRTSSPRFQMEEQRPAEQKKSLLQQLLSEPP